jgi:transcriptional regulator with XRE-family HTH domain
MLLDAFLAENQIRIDQFAEAVGVHPTTIYRLLAGRTIPHRRTLRKILELTKGQVGVSELLRRQAL